MVVVDVQPQSAASDAGLEAGDILKQVDGKDVSGPQTLRDAIQGHQPGSTISIEVDRDGQLKTLSAVLGSQPVDRPRSAAAPASARSAAPRSAALGGSRRVGR